MVVIATMTASAYDFMVGGLCYNYNSDGTSVTVTYERTSSPRYSNLSGAVNIPSTVTYNGKTYSVTSIGSYAFEYCSGLTSVTIPNSVTAIGKGVFSGCTGLTSVTIPNSVTAIGNGAFWGCSGLTSVTIGNSVTAIGSHAFYCCIGLTSVTIPNSVTSIGYGTFEDCSGLTSVTIPNSVTSIGERAFWGCSGMEYVICLPATPPSGSYEMFPDNMLIYVLPSSINAYKSSNYWKSYSYLPFDEPLVVAKYTSLHIYIGPFVILNSATANGKVFNANNGEIIVDGLMPNTNYQVEVNYTVEGEGSQSKVFDATTKDIEFSANNLITQTTVTPKFRVTRDTGFIPEKCGVTFNGTNYNGSITASTDSYHQIECPKISGLSINTSYSLELWVEFKGTIYSRNVSFNTSAVGVSTQEGIAPTSANITASFGGDAVVQDCYFTFGGQNYNNPLMVTGLKPSMHYSTTCTVVTSGGTQSKGIDFTTPALSMVAQPAIMLSNTSPMLKATTNIADEETSCGFEWRRYDAPAEMPSTKVFSPVAGGIIMGVVKNMTENVYYKYRPFYKASDGTEYYGDWVAFITADAGVYYEPVAYTYAQCLVEGNTATVGGVAMPGSENISSQGFAYWLNTPAHAPATEPKSVPSSGVTFVTATGQRMSATLTDLQRGKTYSFCAFVETASGIFYGEERSFTTEGVYGDVNGDGNITAGDITQVYNHMLNNDTTYGTAYDVNGDGMVTAADITALYDILLNE